MTLLDRLGKWIIRKMYARVWQMEGQRHHKARSRVESVTRYWPWSHCKESMIKKALISHVEYAGFRFFVTIGLICVRADNKRVGVGRRLGRWVFYYRGLSGFGWKRLS